MTLKLAWRRSRRIGDGRRMEKRGEGGEKQREEKWREEKRGEEKRREEKRGEEKRREEKRREKERRRRREERRKGGEEVMMLYLLIVPRPFQAHFQVQVYTNNLLQAVISWE